MPTLLLHNGPIYTLDAVGAVAEALAIRDGRILAVGVLADVRAAAGPRAEPIDLAGRAAIPAITDAHVHLGYHALARRSVLLDDIDDFELALDTIAQAAARLPAGAWLQGRGWDHTLWGGRWPTAADLDRVIGDRPALLLRKDGHSAWASSAALAIAGIDDATPDPAGGRFRRDDADRQTGILLEQAIGLVRQHIPASDTEQRLAATIEAIAEAHSYGMVGMHIPTAATPGDGWLVMHDTMRLRERGALKLRCLNYFGEDGLDAALALGLRSGFGDAWVKLGGLKLFADGALGSETALMLAPYEGTENSGIAVLAKAQLNDLIGRAIGGGLSVMVHAIGDGANRHVLDAIERALRATPGFASPIPNRVEHCQLLAPSDMPRFAELGIIASMQPIHCTQDMDVAQRLWGGRCSGAYAWRSLARLGTTLAFGSDAPVESLNPWRSVHAAVTRQRADGRPDGGWYPDETLTVEQALRGFTNGPAAAAGESHRQGQLAAGFLADIAVLSADPFAIAPAELAQIAAAITILDGEVVYGR